MDLVSSSIGESEAIILLTKSSCVGDNVTTLFLKHRLLGPLFIQPQISPYTEWIYTWYTQLAGGDAMETPNALEWN